MGEMMRRFLCFFTLALLMFGPAHAALGGDRGSVHSDRLAWDASHSRSALNGATVHTLALANGVTVREFVDASGQVFGVAWEGPVQPDFARLLGSFFVLYQDAVRQQRRGVSLQSADLVIESGGMMRAFSGRAYLPAAVPAGLTSQDIR
jgi:hypothetical protein